MRVLVVEELCHMEYKRRWNQSVRMTELALFGNFRHAVHDVVGYIEQSARDINVCIIPIEHT